MNRIGCTLALGLLLCACGDEGGEGDGPSSTEDEATGSAGGSVNAPAPGGPDGDDDGATGDDPAAPQPAEPGPGETEVSDGGPTRGAVSLHVMPSGDCSLGDKWIDMPEVAGGHPVSATSHDELFEHDARDDEGNRVTATCEWLRTEPPYDVGLTLEVRGLDDARFVVLNPGSSEDGVSAEGSLLLSESAAAPRVDATGNPYCSYEFMELDYAGGRVWLKVTCSELKDSEGTESCQITEGYAYFENCKERRVE